MAAWCCRPGTRTGTLCARLSRVKQQRRDRISLDHRALSENSRRNADCRSGRAWRCGTAAQVFTRGVSRPLPADARARVSRLAHRRCQQRRESGAEPFAIVCARVFATRIGNQFVRNRSDSSATGRAGLRGGGAVRADLAGLSAPPRKRILRQPAAVVCADERGAIDRLPCRADRPRRGGLPAFRL